MLVSEMYVLKRKSSVNLILLYDRPSLLSILPKAGFMLHGSSDPLWSFYCQVVQTGSVAWTYKPEKKVWNTAFIICGNKSDMNWIAANVSVISADSGKVMKELCSVALCIWKLLSHSSGPNNTVPPVLSRIHWSDWFCLSPGFNKASLLYPLP